MNKELETIIENEFDCLIDDLGCLIGEEWKAEAIKKTVNQAFVLGGVSNWVTFEENPPKEDGRYLIKQNEAVYIADYYVESDIWQDDHYNRITGVDYWKLLPE